MERPNTRDQFAFYACYYHSFLVKSIRMHATYLPLMRNSKLEIWISGSSGRPQLTYTSYKVTLLLISLWFSVTPLRKVYNSHKTSLALRANKERNSLAKQQDPLASGKFILPKKHLFMWSTPFDKFRCRHYTTTTWNCLFLRFMENVNTQISLSLSSG